MTFLQKMEKVQSWNEIKKKIHFGLVDDKISNIGCSHCNMRIVGAVNFPNAYQCWAQLPLIR